MHHYDLSDHVIFLEKICPEVNKSDDFAEKQCLKNIIQIRTHIKSKKWNEIKRYPKMNRCDNHLE